MLETIPSTMSKAAGRASPHKGRPGRNPAAILKSENGDVNYFSTVVFIFIAVLLLAFILDLFSIISTKQELDHCADQMVKLCDLILPNMQQNIKLRYANEEYFDSLLAVVSKACESAGNKSREFLNMAMKEAVIQEYIRVNPIPATKPYPRRKPTIVILNKANVKKLLKAAWDSGWYLEILLGLFCGLRKGEISGLKFGDFDAENRTIYIRRQITSNPVIPKGGSKIQTYKVIEKPPKTDNSYRLLRIPEAVAKEIEKRRTVIDANKLQYGEQYFDHDYISCQENGLPHSTAAMNSALTKLCSRNGLPHITVHGLRHMYATILVEQKVPLIKISALLGHASVNTTFEYYCEVMDENEQIITFMNHTFVPEGSVATC